MKTMIYWIRSKLAAVFFKLYCWIDPDTPADPDEQVYIIDMGDLNCEQIREGD
ncbi:MAG: hypothetical protein R3268_03515 [Acidiferrobacterales bacterium]|nr:hypothetical protein [Acidiferrobacterales bacterium]